MVYSLVNTESCQAARVAAGADGGFSLGKAWQKRVAVPEPVRTTAVAREFRASGVAASGQTEQVKRPRPAAAGTVDLRRRDTREWAETIALRAEHLLPDDRSLARAVFADGMDAKRVAALRGERPRTVRRRVRALAERVLSREFEYVMTHRESWPRTRRLVATSCVLQGRTFREAAAHLRVSLHTVRRQMDLVRALLDEEGAR
ncbi:MAG: hypothetical protein ACTS27_10690 [Phycisphaerales bacterium]